MLAYSDDDVNCCVTITELSYFLHVQDRMNSLARLLKDRAKGDNDWL